MGKLVKSIYRLIEHRLPAPIKTKIEYKRQFFSAFNERPIEYGFVFNCITKIYPKRVLDVGTGITALPHLIRNCGSIVTAIDNVTDYWPSGMKNRHFHVIDADITSKNLKFDQKFDMITCISTLEHIKDADQAIHNMYSLLEVGGFLVLTCPYKEDKYIENVYELQDSNAFDSKINFVCQAFSRSDINRWIKDDKFVIVDQQFWRFWDGEYWSAGNRVIPPVITTADQKHQLTCVLLQKLS